LIFIHFFALRFEFAVVGGVAGLNHERMRHEKYYFKKTLFAALIGITFSTVGLQNNGLAVEQTNNTHTSTISVTEGKASFYAGQFHGRKTANGETFNMAQLTAAHPSLPFGTWVRVTNLRNGKDVVVRINDRGPFVKGRVIDLSAGAAKEIGILKTGVVQVKLEALKTRPSAVTSG